MTKTFGFMGYVFSECPKCRPLLDKVEEDRAGADGWSDFCHLWNHLHEEHRDEKSRHVNLMIDRMIP